ncbi:hypothetical protein M083_1241 [Bacteroides fragilis str. 3986 T(B)9]|uniref:Uncharacterized protein n=1 Tax=Bacteroides fragilis str. 3976T8 TaxID=1339314 RepID=A0A016CS68_BACFG|nr:hypothetical protein M080_1213 [Bacteroides fragilis str. 3397 T10]EXY61285.1 hypothetical protein M111_1126 [Bacteroides fragilis str. 3986T(B)10]EXY66447.1 hypothetical protein M085_1051 [Bacteroides fragilis str. 3986 N(B)19]EXY71093.1 hypothetical protein M083_1241 [Bacteroides fragilis str. 3986 T(B)9]EXZ74174.1 hypothetical protein M123_1372 [Bacteroides fragilis str. 3976T8]EXZ95415.1 hypothetical protein M065_2127 [Bacteroides fragilis str. Korea 419]EYA49147.1 hypothetical protein
MLGMSALGTLYAPQPSNAINTTCFACRLAAQATLQNPIASKHTKTNNFFMVFYLYLSFVFCVSSIL